MFHFIIVNTISASDTAKNFKLAWKETIDKLKWNAS